MKIKQLLFTLVSACVVIFTLVSFKKKSLKEVEVVHDFDLSRYLGTWYEIARLDFKWERNLEQVTAEYTLRNDGKIRVDNKGFNYKTNKWAESIGKAKPAGSATEGRLKVSFFGPFYSAYNVVALHEYKYALVVGESTDYMWILSREKTIPADIKNMFLEKARSIGIITENLVWVKH